MNSEAARPVTCPHCSARYLLPAQLVGPGGARITCPSCRKTFLVPASEAVAAQRPPEAAHMESAQAEDEADRIEPVALPPNAATPVEARPSARSAGAPAPAGQPSPDDIAREVVGGLVERHGPAIVAANSVGKLFAECGADIMSAYDDYRKRAGSAAGAAPFRSALRDQLGIELPEGSERARR